MELVLSELQTRPRRKTLIAIDLGEYSEKIISHIFVFTRDILCDYTVFHCLDGTTTEAEARLSINRALERTRKHLREDVPSNIFIHITNGNLIDELIGLKKTINYGTVVIGTTNKAGGTILGSTATDILKSVPAAVIIVPQEDEAIFPMSISVLVEKMSNNCRQMFGNFHLFVEHYGIFLNFIIFARDKQALEEEKKLIAEYQEYFESIITFSFIVEQEQSYRNFLKYIDGINCESAVLAWNEKILNEDGTISCSTKIPVLYLKSVAGQSDNPNVPFMTDEE